MTTYHETFSFSNEDRSLLASLKVPIPNNEQKRIEILRQSKLIDEPSVESGFSRFISLASRLFDVRRFPVAVFSSFMLFVFLDALCCHFIC
jgi:hypothetical protein